jgi:starch-binding outer membrane protein, SusD/RagB family
MKHKLIILIIALAGVGTFYACKKSFLEVDPQGVLDETTLSSEKGLNKLLLAAYAMLDGHDGALTLGGEWGSGASNFVFGGMGGGEANKGSDPGDQENNMKNVIRHEYTPTNGALNDRWKALYEGVKRANTVLEVLAKVENLNPESQNNIAGQARFLRAWYHFQARITYGKPVFMDEQKDIDLALGIIVGVANDTEIYPAILEDARYAWENLPRLQDAVGRVNKWTAGALYGKVLLFTKDFATAKTVLTSVVDSGTNSLGVKFDLNTNYDDNFNVDFDNNKESVFAFQSSSLDNASARNANWGDQLNTPSATGGGGGGFYTPTYFFANKFKTGSNGLPVANPYNNEVYDPFGQPGFTRYNGPVDPRLDWTIGRDGIPFYDWGTYLTTWPRDKSAGPYAGKKTMIRSYQVAGTHDASIWFVAGGTALNLNLIRFSDVILMAAEAEIEAGTLANATALINRVRTRAAGSRTVKTYRDPAKPTEGFTDTDAANYNVKPYPNVFASQDEARAAVRLERSLELGMEGWRFFDLVRWGISGEELNQFYDYESPMPYQVLLKPKPVYTEPEDDYYAIPQQQIDLSNGFIKP